MRNRIEPKRIDKRTFYPIRARADPSCRARGHGRGDGRRDPQLQLPMRQPDQGDARDAPPFHRDLGRPAKTVREFRERH